MGKDELSALLTLRSMWDAPSQCFVHPPLASRLYVCVGQCAETGDSSDASEPRALLVISCDVLAPEQMTRSRLFAAHYSCECANLQCSSNCS